MELEGNKEYSVNWKNHMSHVRQAFDHLLNTNELTDVTLCCEGKKIRAHKMLLSACSGYFRDIFKESPCQHPVILLYGVEYSVLSDILRFIYNGEVSVDNSKLESFLKVAQVLQISGLTDDPKVVNTSAVATSSRHEETCVSNTISDLPTQSIEDMRRVPKRMRIKEAETSKEKAQKQENDALLITDVKCEPIEFVDFDAVEDSLQAAQTPEQKDFFDSGKEINSALPKIPPNVIGTNHNMVSEEDIKIEGTFLESSTLLDSETKVKHSNFSEDCLKCPVCSKVFSHPYSLHHHKAVHSGNTQCPICHAVLSRKYNLKMHMKARHNLQLS